MPEENKEQRSSIFATKLDDALGMANKHNHKIMITDIAISKVPYIAYPNFSSSECKVVQTLARETLRIAKNQNESNEVALVFALEGDFTSDLPKFGVSLGDEHDVEPAESAESYHLLHTTQQCILVLTHNHPSTATFSLPDISTFIRYDNIKLLIAISNQGKIYYLLRDENYDRNKALALFHEAILKDGEATNLKERIVAAKHFLTNCFSAGIKYNCHN